MDYFSYIGFAQLEKKMKFVKNYKLRNGEFDFKDYQSDVDLDKEEIIKILGEVSAESYTYLKHYPIINTPLNTLKGELITRPRKERVKALDEISESEILSHRTELLFKAAIDKLQGKLDQMSPEEQNQYYSDLQSKISSYSTKAEQWGNKALTAFKYYFNYQEKNEDGFADFLTCAEEFHHFYPDNSKIGFNYKIENPVNVWYLGSPNARKTSDCWAVGTLELMSISQIVDEFKLSKQEVDQLVSKELSMDGNLMYTSQTPTLPDPTLWQWAMNMSLDQLANATLLNSMSFGNQQYHAVVKAYWKGKKKLFKRTYLDEEGYQRTEYVDETYKKDPASGDISLEEEWINQWFRSTKIGPYVYKEIEELEFNDTCPIVGIINTTKNTKGKSLLDLMKPYQVLYNVCMNQIWELLSKEIGVVYLGDLKLIPNKDSDDPIEHMIWQAKEKGTIFVDTSAENAGGDVRFNQITRLDLSRSMEIQTRIQLAQALRMECWELIGVTRERAGSVMASQSATGVNASLSQSYSQTELWFKFHEDLMRDVLQTAINIMQWVELKKPESILNYVNSDLDNIFFKINREELLRDLFVFATNAKEDKEMMDTLKQLMQPAMQNGADLMDLAEILSANAENKIKDVLKRIQDRKDRQLQQQQELEQQQLEQQQQQFEIAQQQLQQQHQEAINNENLNKQLDREAKIQVAQIQAMGYDKDAETDNTGQIAEATKLALEKSKLTFEQMVKMKELEQEDERMKIDREELKSREKIAAVKKKQSNKKK